jgi:hypothetical protein
LAENAELEEHRQRARLLIFERWREQLETTFVPRRARTLGPLSALDELVALAAGFVRAGGQTRPGVDPDEAGHGIAMLPDVAHEAGDILSADEVLAHAYPKRKQVLAELAERLRSKDNASTELIEQLRAILATLRGEYVVSGFGALGELLSVSPRSHEAIIAAVDALVSELRSQGWSDDALREAAATAADGSGFERDEALSRLEALVTASTKDFECYVSVSLPAKRPPFPDDEPSFQLVDALPEGTREGRPLKGGPYIRARVAAHDAAGAALIAHQRSVSTLGALKVFLPGSQADVSSEVVGVFSEGTLKALEVQDRLIEEPRFATEQDIVRILRSSWKTHELRAADPLHDAIRLRHRALLASDAESRLLLLWSGIERMTGGARGLGAALTAARELVSHAMSFGKLRRDVGDLIACVQHHVAKDEAHRKRLLQLTGSEVGGTVRVDRTKFLEYLMADKPKMQALVGVVYETSPLLAFRCHELWRALGEGNRESTGPRLAEYHERSRERVSRQVARIYRARNRVAHVGASPDRVRDLVWHAHFYLTQLTAICVHYGATETTRAQELLVRRMGQYTAFVKLLKAGDPTALTAENLLKPSRVVG